MFVSKNLHVVLEAQYGVHIREVSTLNLGKGIEDMYPNLMSFSSSLEKISPKVSCYKERSRTLQTCRERPRNNFTSIAHSAVCVSFIVFYINAVSAT